MAISQKTVQQAAVERLREAILAGVFRPGERLFEADLCISLGVSRPSLREALRSLAAERLLEIVPNRGPQIPVLTLEAAAQIYDVRKILEGEAAALCASNATDAQVAELVRALSGFREAVARDEGADCIRTTARFYEVILTAAGNDIIKEILEGLLARVNLLRNRSMSIPGRRAQSCSELEAICAGIERRDPVAARKAAQKHVTNARSAAFHAFALEQET
jgi:DNA-binding GntR family transcriptional regulator